jgi:fused signal recognition particle receptor
MLAAIDLYSDVLPGVLLVIAVVLLYRTWRRRAGGGATLGPPPTAMEQLRKGLSKTRARFGTALRRALGREPSEETIEELEVALLEADMGIDTTEAVLEDLRRAYRSGAARTTDGLLELLKQDLAGKLAQNGGTLASAGSPPTVILVVGVNGVGKTTSIAKLANHLKASGKSVLLAAGDTFRAAAVDQLKIWAERLGVGIVAAQTGSDPASVVHDAVEAAAARKVDYLIVDTAGRLHTQKNLMNELEKIKRVIRKRIPDAPHEVLMVLDATTGQNAIVQARAFNDITDVTGIFLAKLDGTAKGGVVVAIRNELDLARTFVDALFAG